jgi:UDP-galactopyranose mutase
MKKIAIVGAGFSGAVIARELAKSGYTIEVFDSRDHVAGNCHTRRDSKTNIMLHVYGPHIFHTSNAKVWDYIRQFDEFMPFVNRVKANFEDRIYPLPINLLTINSLFRKALRPQEALKFIEGLSDKSIVDPKSFEEQALKFIGKELYETFFKGYTIKQWGVHPSCLPASILKRLPIRFNYDDNYYSSVYQGMPKNGYTYIVERILDHSNIKINLATKFERKRSMEYDHIFYSGPIDAWFDNSLGRLTYRTLDFKEEHYEGDYQGNAVINFCSENVPWTRISEHKHFSPWEKHANTVIFKEYSRECLQGDTPYYPVRLLDDKSILRKYIEMAKNESNITFIGRLGTYRYLDMHITIEEALKTSEMFLGFNGNSELMPKFSVDMNELSN